MRGTILADFNAHRVRFDLATKANPSEMAGLLGEKAARIMAPYRFGPRMESNLRGLIDFENPFGTAWTAEVVNEGFSYWKFTATRAQAALVFTNNALQINDFDADFYGGKLRGNADFAFSGPEPTYNFDFSVENADVHAILVAIKDRESGVTGDYGTGSHQRTRGGLWSVEREGRAFRGGRRSLAGACFWHLLAGPWQHEGDPR